MFRLLILERCKVRLEKKPEMVGSKEALPEADHEMRIYANSVALHRARCKWINRSFPNER